MFLKFESIIFVNPIGLRRLMKLVYCLIWAEYVEVTLLASAGWMEKESFKTSLVNMLKMVK